MTHEVTIGAIKIIPTSEQSAVRVESLRVGDPIKLLHKTNTYSKERHVYLGVIVRLDLFPSRPTIGIAAIRMDANDPKLVMIDYSADNKTTELIRCQDSDLVEFDRRIITTALESEVTKAEVELRRAQERIAYYRRYWGQVFSSIIEIG